MSRTVSSPLSILFIDDDADIQKAARILLSRNAFTLHAAHSAADAWAALQAHAVDLVLLDLNFSAGATTGAEGLALLDALLAHNPDLPVVVVTAHSGVRIAVEAMRAGAIDFVMKPWNNERFVATLMNAYRHGSNRQIPKTGTSHAPSSTETALIGESPVFETIRSLVHKLAATAAPVLVSGAAGVGKSLVARTLHRLSSRRDRRLVILDLPALSSDGGAALHAAFDGIDAEGSILLDGLEGLGRPHQALLSTLLDGVQGARLLSASRVGTGVLQAKGFQSDLLSRLGLFEIALPPLRDRGDDNLILADHFLSVFKRTYDKQSLVLTEAAIDAIRRTEWKEEIRGLRQAIERAVLLLSPDQDAIDLESLWQLGETEVESAATVSKLRDTERVLVEAALRRHKFNVSHAANELGLSRTALYRRMARYGL